MVGELRLENMRELASKAIEDKIPGHFIETGVWRGGCCILMKAIVEAYQERGRRVFVADSFQGLPPPRPELYPADAGDSHHLVDALRVSADDVRANFARYDLLDDDVVFLEGFFQDTLPKLDASPFALIRLDGDMYESTIVALEALYEKLSGGGFVIIDDYGEDMWTYCRQAVEDFRQQRSIETPLVKVDSKCSYWRKDA